eukprot:scaffold88175_cov26-Tisochrysis_lutea.AAC.3
MVSAGLPLAAVAASAAAAAAVFPFFSRWRTLGSGRSAKLLMLGAPSDLDESRDKSTLFDEPRSLPPEIPREMSAILDESREGSPVSTETWLPRTAVIVDAESLRMRLALGSATNPSRAGATRVRDASSGEACDGASKESDAPCTMPSWDFCQVWTAPAESNVDVPSEAIKPGGVDTSSLVTVPAVATDVKEETSSVGR